MNNESVPQMGHVKDGEVTRYEILRDAVGISDRQESDGRYWALAKGDWVVLASDYDALRSRAESAEKANAYMADQLQGSAYSAKDVLALRAELVAARARAAKLVTLLDYARTHLGWTVGAEQYICEQVEAIMAPALTSLEGGQNPDSRQAE